MPSGIALLGVVTATPAMWLVEHVAAAEKEQTQDIQQQLDDLRLQLQEVLGPPTRQERWCGDASRHNDFPTARVTPFATRVVARGEGRE